MTDGRDAGLRTGGGEDPAAGRAFGADPSGLAPGREFDLIREFLRGGDAAPPRVRVGPGDDCAVVGDGVVLTIDLSVEGVHFRREWLPPAGIGRRATMAALSDLAAMAARPIGVLVSLALPAADAGEFAVGVMAGVREAVGSVGGTVLGGDLTRSLGPLVVDVAAVGEASDPVLRRGARPGDEVWVTGWLGGAGAAVQALTTGVEPDAAAFERFAAPVARIAEALWVAERGIPKAMLDLSDGLGGDAWHLARASRVGILLDGALLPAHPAARALGAAEATRLALSGGEDYELCFAARPGSVQPAVDAFAARFDIPLTRVGMVDDGEGVRLRDAHGRTAMLDGSGYQHFRSA